MLVGRTPVPPSTRSVRTGVETCIELGAGDLSARWRPVDAEAWRAVGEVFGLQVLGCDGRQALDT